MEVQHSAIEVEVSTAVVFTPLALLLHDLMVTKEVQLVIVEVLEVAARLVVEA